MKAENPAKVFLRRYRSLCGRVDALSEAIEDAMGRAYLTGYAFREKVRSSPALHDPMAERVADAVDAAELLYAEREKASKALTQILNAVNSVPDEGQKEVLTRRYISGQSFAEIAKAMHYGEAQIYVIHGRALLGINAWLEVHGDESTL